MPPYFNGMLFGLIFILSFGPGFFALLQTSVQQGLPKALFLVLGISISDMLFITLALMGVSSFLDNPDVKMVLAIGGAVVLIAYSIFSWTRKPKIYEESESVKLDRSYLKYTLKGFVINGFNPFILVFWIGIIGYVSVNHDYDTLNEFYFFSGVLSTILIADTSKAFLANRLRKIITPKFLLIMNRTVAVILFIFGVRLLLFMFNQNADIELPF